MLIFIISRLCTELTHLSTSMELFRARDNVLCTIEQRRETELTYSMPQPRKTLCVAPCCMASLVFQRRDNGVFDTKWKRACIISPPSTPHNACPNRGQNPTPNMNVKEPRVIKKSRCGQGCVPKRQCPCPVEVMVQLKSETWYLEKSVEYSPFHKATYRI